MKKSPKVSASPKKIIVIVVVLLLLVVIAVGTYLFIQYKNSGSLFNKPQAAKQDNTKLVDKVGKLIKLPSETPSVATVSDITKLKNQTLFQNAENGDKVLIFNQAKRAIVYRPSTNQIIEVGNVVVAPQASTSVSPAANEKVVISLLNATKTAGYAKKVGADLVGKYPNLEINGTGNANGAYTKNKIYVVKSNKVTDQIAENIATVLNGEVVTKFPDNEEKPKNADILIILGQ